MKAFLELICSILKNVQWKNVWEDLQKIPTSLKYCLVIAITMGVTYFGYQKCIEEAALISLQEDVIALTKKVNQAVPNNYYKEDLTYIISSIKILETIETYAYQEEQSQLTLIKKFIAREHPNDPIIQDIDAMYSRNDLMYQTMSQQFKRVLNNCNTNIVKDSTYLIK